MLKLLCSTIVFLTRLPVGRLAMIDGSDLARTARFFPLVGWLLGGLLALAAWLLTRMGLPPLLLALLLICLHVWLTRALHLDGFADLLDGLGVNGDPARRLSVMKDSAVGVFGAAGLCLLLLLKIVTLSVLLQELKAGLLLLLAAGPVIGRFVMVVLAYRSAYPRLAGTGQAFVGRVSGLDLAVAILFVLPVLAGGWPGLAAVSLALASTGWLRYKAYAKLGGITGDVLGAACELAEVCTWLAAVICMGLARQGG